jgi:hypothetical protein
VPDDGDDEAAAVRHGAGVLVDAGAVAADALVVVAGAAGVAGASLARAPAVEAVGIGIVDLAECLPPGVCADPGAPSSSLIGEGTGEGTGSRMPMIDAPT